MCATKVKDEEGRPIQFVGSGYINRYRNGKGCDCAPDAAFLPVLLYGLKWGEGEIDVDMTISLEPFAHARVMWCFGDRIESRCLTPYRPTPVKGKKDTFNLCGSFLYLDNWTTLRYFEQMPAGSIFPVFVSVKRAEQTNKTISNNGSKDQETE